MKEKRYPCKTINCIGTVTKGQHKGSVYYCWRCQRKRMRGNRSTFPCTSCGSPISVYSGYNKCSQCRLGVIDPDNRPVGPRYKIPRNKDGSIDDDEFDRLVLKIGREGN